MQAPKLVFFNSEGQIQETLFADYVPVSMVRDIIKEKEWADSKTEPKSEL